MNRQSYPPFHEMGSIRGFWLVRYQPNGVSWHFVGLIWPKSSNTLKYLIARDLTLTPHLIFIRATAGVPIPNTFMLDFILTCAPQFQVSYPYLTHPLITTAPLHGVGAKIIKFQNKQYCELKHHRKWHRNKLAIQNDTRYCQFSSLTRFDTLLAEKRIHSLTQTCTWNVHSNAKSYIIILLASSKWFWKCPYCSYRG